MRPRRTSQELGPLHGAPVIGGLHGDWHAHLLKPRPHAGADAVAERFLARKGPTDQERIDAARGLACREIGVIGGDDGRALVHIPRVQDVFDRIEHPLGDFGRAQLINDKYLGLENGPEQLMLRRLHLRVIGVGNRFKKLPVAVEQRRYAFFKNKRLENRNRQMRFADSDRAREQEADAVVFAGVDFQEALCRVVSQEQLGARFVAVQGVARIAVRDPCPPEQGEQLPLMLSGAGLGRATAVVPRADAHPHAVAERAARRLRSDAGVHCCPRRAAHMVLPLIKLRSTTFMSGAPTPKSYVNLCPHRESLFPVPAVGRVSDLRHPSPLADVSQRPAIREVAEGNRDEVGRIRKSEQARAAIALKAGVRRQPRPPPN